MQVPLKAWIVTFAGTAVNLCLGILYAWSVWKANLVANAAHPASTQGLAAEDPPAGEPELSPREAAAMRHAEERVERVEQALERMPEMEAKIKPGQKKEARVSTTDPQATVMKMADGGFRPAYNVEYATTCDGQVVVAAGLVEGPRRTAQLG